MDNWRRFRIGGNSIVNGKDTPTLDAANGSADVPTNDKEKEYELGDDLLWGLENFGNTCYCNSVLQALYASPPFRHFVEAYPEVNKPYNALGGPVASEPIRTPSPDNASAAAGVNGAKGSQTTADDKDKPPAPGGKRGLSFGFGKKSNDDKPPKPSPASLQPAAAAPTTAAGAAQQAPPPIVLPHDPDFPDMTLFSTIQTLFQHLSTSLPHHPAAPKTPPGATPNGVPQTNATGNNAASLPSASLVSPTTANGTTVAANGQPQGPALLASLPPPSTPRGGGPYLAGTLGRGVVRPEDVLRTVRKHHVMFAGQGQQDAHEFLGFMLNQLAEEVERLDGELKERGQEVTTIQEHGKTFIHNLFQGVLVNETRCLNCETTSSREESFLDLSIDIEQHSSLTACLRQFSHSEMLCSKNKFYCETCCSLVEAERRMRIKSLPNILGLHLKRFRQDEMGRLHKLFYRVTFPLQLRVPCTTEDTKDAERLYELFAVVVHIGNGPTHGHYVTIVRAGSRWVMCDDENMEPIEEADLANYFGDNITGAGYVLFYQAVDLDLMSLGLNKMPEPRVAPSFPGSVPIMEVPEEEGEAAADDPFVDAEEEPSAVSASSALAAVAVPPSPVNEVPPAAPTVSPTRPTLNVTTSAKTIESSGSSRGETPNGSDHRHTYHEASTLSPPSATAPRRDASTGGASSYSRREPSTTKSPGTEKSKWYSLKKRESMTLSHSSNTNPPTPDSTLRRPLRRPSSTTTTLNTVSTTLSGSPDEHDHGPPRSATTPVRTGAPSHSPARSGATSSSSPVRGNSLAVDHHHHVGTDLSSSMLSTSTNSSSNHSSLSVPLAIPRGNHGSRSHSMSRPDRGYNLSRADRTASGTHFNGGSSAGGNSYAGGSSLGRKISGAAGFGKLKMSFGKKHKVDE